MYPPVPAPLTPAMHHVLLALLDGDAHGYALMKRIEAFSEGSMRLGPASLYGAIKRLLDAGLVREVARAPDPGDEDERRRYYRITPAGRQAVRTETERLQRLVAFALGAGVA